MNNILPKIISKMTSSNNLQELNETICNQGQEKRRINAEYIELEKENINFSNEFNEYCELANIIKDHMKLPVEDLIKNVVTPYDILAAHLDLTAPINDEQVSAVIQKIDEIDRAAQTIILGIESPTKQIENYKLELQILETSNELFSQESTTPLKLKELKYFEETEYAIYEQTFQKLKEETVIYETYKNQIKRHQDENKVIEENLLNYANINKQVGNDEDQLLKDSTALISLLSNLINNIKNLETYVVDDKLDIILNEIKTLPNYISHNHSTVGGNIKLKQHLDERDLYTKVVNKLFVERIVMQVKCNQKMEEITKLKELCQTNVMEIDSQDECGRTYTVMSKDSDRTN